MKKIKKLKLVVLILILIISVIFFGQYLNRYLIRSKATTEKVVVNFTSDTIEFKENEEKAIGMTLNASKEISGIDLRFELDSNLLDFIGYETNPLNYFTDEIIKSVEEINNGTKVLRLVLVARKPSNELESSLILNLKFKSKNQTGEGILRISEKNQVVGVVEGDVFEIQTENYLSYKVTDLSNFPQATNTSTPTRTPTPMPTQTPPPTRTPTPPSGATNLVLNLTLRFQGIVDQCPAADKKIKVKAKLAGVTEKDYQQADFSCQEGRWRGSFSFDAPPNSGYIVYIKGDKHLQKKVCDQIPQESTLGPGTYNCRDGKITLNSGENNLDFSGIMNLYGDLPVGGSQDGVINSLDTSHIRNSLGSTNPEVLAICDGNLDGKCDTQDWSMLIMALSIKGDEL